MCSLALADALADAPSLWTLGNAGMGALQVSFYFDGYVQDLWITKCTDLSGSSTNNELLP